MLKSFGNFFKSTLILVIYYFCISVVLSTFLVTKNFKTGIWDAHYLIIMNILTWERWKLVWNLFKLSLSLIQLELTKSMNTVGEMYLLVVTYRRVVCFTMAHAQQGTLSSTVLTPMSVYRGLREELPLLPLLTHSLLESDKLILAVDQSLCSNPAVVGGKAASLALLADVANTVLKNKVVESLH